jgi:L-iditol 2-dehydrogenase
MHMPAHSCFPVPDGIDDVEAALLEPLGVAIHAVDLARIRVSNSVAILGAGPIGLLILQMAKLAGAFPIYVSDRFSWRLALAERLGGIPVNCAAEDQVSRVQRETHGRGVDVAIEAAWGADSVGQACELTRLGGCVVLVGIPSDDRLTLKHSTARRKGLTILLCRRMKHVYPRAIDLTQRGVVNLSGLVSHRFPLARAAEAFALNAAYRGQVVKTIIDVGSQG